MLIHIEYSGEEIHASLLSNILFLAGFFIIFFSIVSKDSFQAYKPHESVFVNKVMFVLDNIVVF